MSLCLPQKSEWRGQGLYGGKIFTRGCPFLGYLQYAIQPGSPLCAEPEGCSELSSACWDFKSSCSQGCPLSAAKNLEIVPQCCDLQFLVLSLCFPQKSKWRGQALYGVKVFTRSCSFLQFLQYTAQPSSSPCAQPEVCLALSSASWDKCPVALRVVPSQLPRT